jgi:hypothetical protein
MKIPMVVMVFAVASCLAVRFCKNKTRKVKNIRISCATVFNEIVSLKTKTLNSAVEMRDNPEDINELSAMPIYLYTASDVKYVIKTKIA